MKATESTRRALAFQYLVGVNRFAWADTTIFGEIRETRPSHSLTTRVQMNQPWGRLGVELSANQYLHDLAKYGIEVGGNGNFRFVYEEARKRAGSLLRNIRCRGHLAAFGVGLGDDIALTCEGDPADAHVVTRDAGAAQAATLYASRLLVAIGIDVAIFGVMPKLSTFLGAAVIVLAIGTAVGFLDRLLRGRGRDAEAGKSIPWR